MKSTIINIGDELLIGQVVNTNASQMSKMLIAAGIEVVEVVTIADDRKAIEQSLKRGLATSDTVLITGGLGPTKDDITKKTLCDFFHSEMYENEEALANIKRIFDARGYELTETNRLQAWVPRCCTMINNVVGTAPCMWFEVVDNGQLTDNGLPHDGARQGSPSNKVVVSLPGVPFEMVNLMETEVVPRLRSHFHCDYILNKNILVQGIGESFLSDLIEPWELSLPENIRLAYLPQAGMVKMRLTARGADETLLKEQIRQAVEKLYPIAGKYIVGEDLESLPELVAYTMTHKQKTLSTAESCTGGSIAASLTAMPGASRYFKGSVVSYCNEVKERVLGVDHQTLATMGAVSQETVEAMALGVLRLMGTDFAIATTGVAGPDGGTEETPVGTVWIAVASKNGVVSKKMKYGDRRAQTIERARNEAFSMLMKQLRIEDN